MSFRWLIVLVFAAEVWRDPEFDARLRPKPEHIAFLAKLMNDGRELGFPVLDPIVPGQAAHPPGAHYRLVAGHDLLGAYGLIGLLNFSARLSPARMDERSVRVMNIREAIRLETLDEYERERAFESFAVCGLAQADIVAAFESDRCGLTTVKESLFTSENLMHAALEAWRTDRISYRTARALARRNPDEQLDVLTRWIDNELARKLAYQVSDEKPSI